MDVRARAVGKRTCLATTRGCERMRSSLSIFRETRPYVFARIDAQRHADAKGPTLSCTYGPRERFVSFPSSLRSFPSSLRSFLRRGDPNPAPFDMKEKTWRTFPFRLASDELVKTRTVSVGTRIERSDASVESFPASFDSCSIHCFVCQIVSFETMDSETRVLKRVPSEADGTRAKPLRRRNKQTSGT